jgi:hypothetical protein
VLALCLTSLFAAGFPTHLDSRQLASELVVAGVAPTEPIVLIDTKKNGLALYGFSSLEHVTLASEPYPFYSPPEPWSVELSEIAGRGEVPSLLVSPTNAERVASSLAGAGISFVVRELRLPYVLIRAPSPRAHGGPAGAILLGAGRRTSLPGDS